MTHREWIHICWLNDGTTSKSFLNGKLYTEYSSSSPFRNIKIDKNIDYSMIFGQEADSFKGTFSSAQSLRGRIAEFQIWNYTLSVNIIAEISTCKSTLRGNIVSWAKEYITFHGVQPVITDSGTFCIPYEKVIFINDPMNYKDADAFCSIHKGYVYTPQTQARNSWMIDMLNKSNTTCGDESWLNHRSKQVVNQTVSGATQLFNNWVRNRALDNCGVIRHDGFWTTQESNICTHHLYCFACGFVQEPVFTVKGFCSNFIPSNNYYLSSGAKGIHYVGYKNSAITKTENGWNLWGIDGTEVVRTTYFKNYPVGRTNWIGTYEDCQLRNEEIMLTISTCNMDTFFTCNSGHCIDLEKYCNTQLDCDDGSDEDDCKNIILTDKRYSINDPPTLEKTNENFLINVEIIQFDNFDSLKMTMTLTMDIQISWKDSRLTFKNLPRFNSSEVILHDLNGMS